MPAPALGAGGRGGAGREAVVERHELQMTEGLTVCREGQIQIHLGER